MKKIFKVFILLCLILLILRSVAYLYIPKYLDFNPRLLEQLNNVEVLFIGPSTSQLSISPLYIWHNYGVTSYNLSSSAQNYDMSYYLLKKYISDDTKIVFFDITLFLREENPIQNTIYAWYLNIFDRIKYYSKQNDYIYKYTLLYSFNSFHTRWKSLTKEDFSNNNLYGFRNTSRPFIIRKQQPFNIDKTQLYTKIGNLENNKSEFITTLEQFAKKNNIKIIYWIRPFTKGVPEKYLNVLKFEKYAEEHNLDFINFNNSKLSKTFNYKKDFYDAVHPNIYGGKRIMDYLMQYAIKQYKISNHNNDSKYVSWDRDYIKYIRIVNREEIRRINFLEEWQNLAYYDNYTMLISANSDNLLNRLPQKMKDKFKLIGLNKFETDKTNQKYVAIIDNGKVFYEEVSDSKAEYKGRMNNIVNLQVSAIDKNIIINISGKPKAKNKYGINFVLYDKVNREIVDSIWIDPKEPNKVRR